MVSRDLCRLGLKCLDTRPDVIELATAHHRPHTHVCFSRVADDNVLEACLQGVDKHLEPLRWHKNPANCCALLTRLLSHIGYDFVEHHLPCFTARLDVRSHYRGIEAIRLDIDSDGSISMCVQPTQDRARAPRSGKCKNILRPEMIDQITNRSGDEGECAVGQNTGLDNDLRHPIRQQRRTRGGVY